MDYMDFGYCSNCDTKLTSSSKCSSCGAKQYPNTQAKMALERDMRCLITGCNNRGLANTDGKGLKCEIHYRNWTDDVRDEYMADPEAYKARYYDKRKYVKIPGLAGPQENWKMPRWMENKLSDIDSQRKEQIISIEDDLGW